MGDIEPVHSLNTLIQTNTQEGILRVATRADLITHYLTGEQVGNTEWSHLRGKRILDIGCGSDQEIQDGIYPPYLARMLGSNGAEVYGIDSSPVKHPDQEPYAHIVGEIASIVMRGALASVGELQGKQFDAVTCTKFLSPRTSPAFQHQLTSLDSAYFSPNAIFYSQREAEFIAKLLQQLVPMLKENGVVLLEDRTYKKIAGKLEELSPIPVK